jgi:formylmethanofuran--tetrahydromethanopterin N-formyltransferase
MTAEIDDTYAEGFRSIFCQALVTARDRKWLNHAVSAATGHASSTIMCDCEAAVDRFVGPGVGEDGDEAYETPDGRPGAILQFHVPKFRKDRIEAMNKALMSRIGMNVLTCPTTACWSLDDQTSLKASDEPYVKLGRKIAYFGDGYEKLAERCGRKMWVIPTMGGEFAVDRRFQMHPGIMGGNLWFLGDTEAAAIEATERGVEAVNQVEGVIQPFPGGIAASASKAGSRYKFLFASTYAEYCPTMREELGDRCELPAGVQSVMEIVINGRDHESVDKAMQAAIHAAKETPGLIKISAGNYDGRLGKTFFYLRPESRPAE